MESAMSGLKNSLTEAGRLLNQFISDENNISGLEQLSVTLAEIYKKGNKILIAGNGGSLTDAMHFAEELTGRFCKDRPALPAISLADPSHITCVGNDYGFDAIFSRGVEAFGKPGDFFIGLSTSGNSPNIIKAHEAAKKLQLGTLLLLGKDGGLLKGKGDFEFIIPGSTSDRIQEIHMLILHLLVEGIERNLFPENYR